MRYQEKVSLILLYYICILYFYVKDDDSVPEESISDSVNHLWRTYRDSNSSSSSCIESFICRHIQNNIYRILPSGINMEILLL